MFLFLFYNCATEESVNTVTETNELKSRLISLDELKQMPMVMNKLNEINQQQTEANARTLNSAKYKFSINTERVLLIERGDYRSLTFPVVRDSANGYMENIFLHPHNGKYIAYLFKYKPTQAQFTALENGTATAEMFTNLTFTVLDDFDLGEDIGVEVETNGGGYSQHIVPYNGQCWVVNNVWENENGELMYDLIVCPGCSCSSGTSGGSGGPAPGPGFNHAQYYAIWDLSNGGGGGGSTGGGSTGGGGGSSTGGGNNGYNPFNPPAGYDGNGDIVTHPSTPGFYTGNPIIGIVSPNNDNNFIFERGLSLSERAFWNDEANEEFVNQIKEYLDLYNYSASAINFGRQLVKQSVESELNFDVNKSAVSPYNIDLSAVSGDSPQEIRFNEIYNKVTTSPAFKKLFVDLFNDSSRYNVKFKIGNLGNGENGLTQIISNSPESIWNEITISNNLLSNLPDDVVALVIIHECIHAFLNVKLKNNPNAGITIADINNMDFVNMINTYYNGFSGDQDQHEFFVDYMTPEIVQILTDIKNVLYTPLQINKAENPDSYNGQIIYLPTNTTPALNSGISTSWNWNNYFQYLSLVGLEQTSSYLSIYPAESGNAFSRDKYIYAGLIMFSIE